jgi:hypothetical protein
MLIMILLSVKSPFMSGCAIIMGPKGMPVKSQRGMQRIDTNRIRDSIYAYTCLCHSMSLLSDGS